MKTAMPSGVARAVITQRRLGPLMHARLAGTVDETFSMVEPHIASQPQCLLDLAHVEHVTSWGIRHWMKFIREMRRDTASLHIARAPPCVVDQLNTIEGFQDGVPVLSVLAPYFCSACNLRQLRPIVLSAHLEAIRAGREPIEKCGRCDQRLEFEDLASEFFAFALPQADASVSEEAALLNQWLCDGDSTADVELRFLRHLGDPGLQPSVPAPQLPASTRPRAPAGRVVVGRDEGRPAVLTAHFYGSGPVLGAARRAALSAGFVVGASVAEADVVFTPLAERAPALVPGQKLVQLFDGRLEPQLGAQLEAAGGARWLALRESGVAPARWELELLHRQLQGGDLLPAAASSTTYEVRSMDALRAVAEAAGELVVQHGGSSPSRDVALDVTYELMTNAMLDAPVDEKGQPKYAFARNETETVDRQDACRCSLTATGELLLIRVSDPFGRLTCHHLAQALSRFRPGRIAVDTSGGGAGLGLRRILTGSDALVVTVVPGQRTDVCAVIRLAEGARRREGLPKSLLIDAPG